MKRSEFIKYLLSTSIIGMGLKNLSAVAKNWNNTERMPVLFVGHGNPMNVIQENDITRGWEQVGKGLKPSAILCISAHWETRGTYVHASPNPRTIYDFGGFPEEMYKLKYPAPGAPELAKTVIDNIQQRSVMEDHEWGLDHGTWTVLYKMFPEANVPVFQMSLDHYSKPAEHYALAKELSFLRRKGVLIVGSGNIVHNLRMARWDSNTPYDWAGIFDERIKELIDSRQHDILTKAEGINREAAMAIPTREHYLPMLYSLALQEEDEEVHYFNTELLMGSMSMRSFVIS